MDRLIQDLRYAVRQLRKNPGFTAVALFTLTLGIGANTAIFSVVHAVLLKPLGYHEPDRVVLVSEGATPVRFEEMMTANRSYTEIGAFSGPEDMALSRIAEPRVLKGARVSPNFLHILGVSPLVGRGFLAEEDKPGAPDVVMISAELWQGQFGRDPSTVGRTITLGGMARTVIGVLPPGFQFPFSGADVWVTKPSELSVIPAQSRPLSPILSVFGRLKPHVDIEQARAALGVFNRQYTASHPGMLDAKSDSPETVLPFKDQLVSDVRSELWMLLGAVGFVLLIVCANIASLVLTRATSRAREFAVRAAIGAGRGQIIGQLLAESILLASVGGVLGIGLASWSLSAIRKMTFVDLPRAGEIQIDGTVLGFALALSVITGVLFGLVPSLAASRPNLSSVLRGGGETENMWRTNRILGLGPRGLLVVGQVALSIVLLIGASLLLESLARVYRVDLGFRTSNLLTVNITLPRVRYETDEKKSDFYAELVKRVEALPGIRSAAVTQTLPLTDSWLGAPLQVVGTSPIPLNERPIGILQNVTPEYFRTLAIALKRGREFTPQDNTRSLPVAIVSENLARLFWPEYPGGPDPIGQRILIGSNPRPVEIVGVVANVRHGGRDYNPRPEVYFPCAQKPPVSVVLAALTNGNPLTYANAVRGQVLAIDRDQPVSSVASMDELAEASEGQTRLVMRLLGTFAFAAALLSVVGLYGLVSYSVLQRRKELGIRRALGAPRNHILSLIAGQALRLTLFGVLLGIGGAFALTRLLKDLLFQLEPTDPVTFVGVSILFVLVGVLASYVPARRAAKVDPMVALRYE